jgi:cytochrome c oxidase subunit 2
MVVVVVAVILLMITAGVAMTRTSLADDSDPESGQVTKEFTIWARQFDFTPAVITVQQGDHVRVNLKTADVAHGWYIDGYDVNIKVSGDKTESVEFTVDKAGIFQYACGLEYEDEETGELTGDCAPDHEQMVGYIIVLDR